MSESRVWVWPGVGAFNPRYDAKESAEGLAYACEISGPCCGYDAIAKQTWAEFMESGPPERVQMPATIAAEIRAFALAQKRRR